MKYSQLIPEHILFSLRFFIPPFLTLILGKVLFELLAFNFLELNQTIIQHTSTVENVSTAIKFAEMKARLLWASSVMLYFFTVIGFTIFICNTLKQTISKSTLLFFILLAGSISLFETYYLLNATSSESPVASIFSFTFDTLSKSNVFTANQLFILQSTLNILNFTAFLIVPFGIVAGCCIMHKIPINLPHKAAYYLDLSEQLKKLITLSSAVMVIGVIHMQLWLSWPLSLIAESNEINQLRSVILIICQYWGISYSLIIAALYFPSASYLTQQAKQALLHGDDKKLSQHPSTWLTKNNMQFSPIASLSQIIAVIAPMLVGTIGSSLSQLVMF